MRPNCSLGSLPIEETDRHVCFHRFSARCPLSACVDDDNELSIPDQKRQGEVWCAACGCEVIGTCVEAGTSATIDRRPKFQRMIEAGTSKPAPYERTYAARSHLMPNGVFLLSVTAGGAFAFADTPVDKRWQFAEIEKPLEHNFVDSDDVAVIAV